MENINNLIGYTAFINMQARLLLEKTEVLSENARNLHRAGVAVGQHAPGTLKLNLDMCDNNLLIRRTLGTADVITRLNGVLDVLITLARKSEEDAKKINKRLRRKRRRDDSDDEINIIMRMREN